MLTSQWVENTPITNPNVKVKAAKKQPCFSKNRKQHKQSDSNKHTSIDINLVQLHFNTKRAGSVLEPNFLHPMCNSNNKNSQATAIDDIETIQEKETTIASLHSKSFFSTTFKKKIGPMEQKAKGKLFIRGGGGGGDIGAGICIGSDEQQSQQQQQQPQQQQQQKTRNLNENNHNNKLYQDNNGRTNEINNSHKSNLNDEFYQCLDEAQGDFLMAPTPTADLTNLDPIEMEARVILLKLGITSEMLCQAVDCGPRSDIIGAYRIVMHRLQKQQMYAQYHDTTPGEEQVSTIPKNNHRICAIL